MTEHPNARLIRRGYESFAAGDLEALRESMVDTVVWHEPGHSSLGGDHRGPEGVVKFLSQLRDLSDGTFRMQLVDVLATPERVVALQEETARRAGRELEMSSAVEFEIHRGKITEVTVYHDDTYHFDQFWS